MAFELEGNLIVKEGTLEVSASFKKREFVIEVINERNAEYNDFIKFQLTQDRCSLLDPIQLGDKMKVAFNIRGRRWDKDGKTNYFSNLEAWKIEVVQAGTTQVQSCENDMNDALPVGDDEDESLPF